jgi:hypothetical protein
MTVKFEFEHDVQTVYATLTDPDFLVDRCLALGELSAECDVEENDDETMVNLVREIQRDLPTVLARVFGSVQVTEMRERWVPCEGGWRGAWKLSVHDQPVTVFGDFELLATPRGCRYSVSHRARAAIPLLGKQVEKFILGQTSGGANDELAYLRDYLAS